MEWPWSPKLGALVNLTLFVLLQAFMAWSTLQFWRIKTMKIVKTVHLVVEKEDPSDGL